MQRGDVVNEMAAQLAGVSQLEEAFHLAAERITKNKRLKVSTDDKLKLYSYFKQAKDGVCSIPRPPFYDITGKAKWDAWKALGNISREEAMMHYVLLVNKLDPSWKDETSLQSVADADLPTSSAKEEGGGLLSVGAAVSTMADKQDIPDNQKTIFDWNREGNINKVKLLLKETDSNIKDENQMTLLHWACDRGNVEMVQLLIDHHVPINEQDEDLQTPLHYGMELLAMNIHHTMYAKFISTKNFFLVNPIQ